MGTKAIHPAPPAPVRAAWDAHLSVVGPVYGLGVGIAVLCATNMLNLMMGQPFWTLTQIINMGLESSLATWYSSMLWAVAAVLAWRCRAAGPQGRTARVWLALAAVFVFFSIDEVAMVHERLGRLLADHGGTYGQLLHTTRWVLMLGPVALAALAALALYARPVYARAPCAWRLLATGLAIFLAAALGIESTTNLLNHSTLQWIWDLEIVTEETIEMIGAWLVVEACDAYRRDRDAHV